MIKKYSSEQFDYDVKFKNIPNEFVESLDLMEKIMHSIIKDILINTKPDDSVKI